MMPPDTFPAHLTDSQTVAHLRSLLLRAGVHPDAIALSIMNPAQSIEYLYAMVQNLPGDKLEAYGKDFANEWEFIQPHASARLNEGPSYALSNRVLANMKQLREYKE